MKKGYTGLPAAVYVVIAALIVIGIIFFFYGALQEKYGAAIGKAFDALGSGG
ncbi:MAG: hypothetical protein JSV92_01090 [archaeon]|nr:MAG: hypothetical protein JSV92_01090 [archaeon]